MQLHLQRKTELALRAMRLLADADGTVPGGELATRLGTTPSYLPQVMAPLVAEGWVSSGRGPGGGYALGPGARRVSMLALIEAAEGPIPSDRCVLRAGRCSSDRLCALHDSWQLAQVALVRELNHILVLPHGQEG